MSLNANNVKQENNNKRVEQEPVKIGNHAARVVQVLDLGLQNQRPFQGQPKPPKHCIQLTYELSHEFLKDEGGDVLEDKPRWISEDFPFNSLKSDLATSTKRYLAIDPEQTVGGDFTKLVGMPCTVGIVHNPGKGKNAGRIFDNVGVVTGPTAMPGYNQPELVNDPKVFTLDEPDMETFSALPEFLQEKIKGNLEFKGSALDVALGGVSAKVLHQDEPANMANAPETNIEREDVKPAEGDMY